jgi:hypothetical protein
VDAPSRLRQSVQQFLQVVRDLGRLAHELLSFASPRSDRLFAGSDTRTRSRGIEESVIEILQHSRWRTNPPLPHPSTRSA